MGFDPAEFERSIREQIAINRARTPTERFEALCALLDAAREMAPRDAAAIERRRRVRARREREREQMRAEYRRLAATVGYDASDRVSCPDVDAG